jgi:hypothetical protein
VAKHDHWQPLATATSGCHLWLNTTTSGPHFIQTFSPNCSFIGDEEFGLSEHMLRPYSGKHLDVAKKIFNYRLSRGRCCIEGAFGILSNKWRILHHPLNTSVHFAEDIVKACCMLHNFVRQRDGYNFHDSLHVCGFEDIANRHRKARKGVADASGCVCGGWTQPQAARHSHYRSMWPGPATTDTMSALSLLKLHTKSRLQLVAATSGSG